MRTHLAALAAVLLAGCSPEIRCWYAASDIQAIGEPWYTLEGLRTTLMSDVRGPKFKTRQELDTYIKDHNLTLCGSK